MTEEQVFKYLCEQKLSFFAKQAFKVIEPETVLEWEWYLDVYCDTLERVYRGELREVDFNVPPRTLKSKIISIIFPCWVWNKKPSKKFLSASSSFDLANKINIKRRELITSDFYRKYWPLTLKSDSNTIGRFDNVHNGFMQSVSAGGKVTGEGADYLLSDDLIDVKDAFSKVKREAVCEWYKNAFYNRAQNRTQVVRINVNQRTHPKDVSHTIKENYNFQTLVIQMVKTNKVMGTIPYNDPRQEGDLLCPKRYTFQDLAADRKGMGIFGSGAQLQQDPKAPDGGIIKKEQLRWFRSAEKDYYDKQIITGDLNFGDGKNPDYVVFACWGRHNGQKYLIDMIRGRWDYAETKARFKAFCEKHPKALEKYIEAKANGPALVSDFRDEIIGIRSWPEKIVDEKGREKANPLASADKVQRVHLIQPEFAGGEVWFPEDLDIKTELEEELLGFSENGSGTGNDDMVDNITMGLIELKKSSSFFG